jgi:hypothetical protein
MGCYDCPEHGLNGLGVLCEHAADQLQSGALEPTRSFELFELCDACFIGATSAPPTIDIETLPHEAFCSMCFDRARVRYARSRGLADPFFVYEHTLWPIHRDELDELKNTLLSHFRFPQCAMSDRALPALFVTGGSYRRPTSITAYGVLDAATQDEITAVVQGFFEKRTRFQRALVFVEEMLVDRWTSADGRSFGRRHRDEDERVLRIEAKT